MYNIIYNNSICICMCIIYNNIIYNITPNGTSAQKLEHKHTSTKHKPAHTYETYTPQPSTPIKHAGSDIWEMSLEYK